MREQTSAHTHTSRPVAVLQRVVSDRFIVPISCVICNDIMAYMFGFFFGRTPLIKVGCLDNIQDLKKEFDHFHLSALINDPCFLQLSPKKTWEGFIGGFFSTIVFGILVKKKNIHMHVLHLKHFSFFKRFLG